ncbi:hypothetical protein HanIR_Chr10g0465801 [Helianthus annuus]|nr:hypothetical protein HanIR_Chr10g0465801 [Helianthus annuus]
MSDFIAAIAHTFIILYKSGSNSFHFQLLCCIEIVNSFLTKDIFFFIFSARSSDKHIINPIFRLDYLLSHFLLKTNTVFL